MLIATTIMLAGCGQVRFKRIPTQYIAALAGPETTSGDNAQAWGLWHLDPGPRGVALQYYDRLKQVGGNAPAGWKFDRADWWLEENGVLMEQPSFPVPPRRYMVTGDRKVRAMLTIYPPDENGDMRWELDNGATIYDVTHLECRSARYKPAEGKRSCSPASAPAKLFPVTPGASMPAVEGCEKQDYAVLLVTGVAVEE
ncbi:MAG: hypothetical protein AAF512_21935 [Pseudomonadota bacterium]